MVKGLGGALVVIGLLAAPAWADSTHECQGNACNGGGGTATATADVNMKTTVKNTVNNLNVMSNEQGQYQGQLQGQQQDQAQRQHQGQGQSQDATANNAGNSQSIHVEGTQFNRYAPPVYAPGLTSAGTGVCLGSVSIGLSGPMAGASFGITKVDKGCELRSNAALLYQFGYRDAAIRLLMKNDDVRDAMGGTSFAVTTPTYHAPLTSLEAGRRLSSELVTEQALTQIQGN